LHHVATTASWHHLVPLLSKVVSQLHHAAKAEYQAHPATERLAVFPLHHAAKAGPQAHLSVERLAVFPFAHRQEAHLVAWLMMSLGYLAAKAGDHSGVRELAYSVQRLAATVEYHLVLSQQEALG
jgi:hypothetical protein